MAGKTQTAGENQNRKQRDCLAFEHRDVRILRRWKLVNLRGQDEIAFGEAVDFVSPNRDLDFPPTETKVRMVSLIFRELTDLIHKLQRFTEV